MSNNNASMFNKLRSELINRIQNIVQQVSSTRFESESVLPDILRQIDEIRKMIEQAHQQYINIMSSLGVQVNRTSMPKISQMDSIIQKRRQGINVQKSNLIQQLRNIKSAIGNNVNKRNNNNNNNNS